MEDEHDPDAPLVRPSLPHSIVRTYERTAYHLQVSTLCVLTLRDVAGHEQTLRVTDEHPFYRQASADAPGGWTPARSLAAGDEVLAGIGVLTVVANTGQAHPQGVKVYNLAGPSRPTPTSSWPNTPRPGRMAVSASHVSRSSRHVSPY